MTTEKKQHNISLVLISLTAIVWGSGFVLGNRLLNNGFESIPMTLNAVRFLCGTIALLVIFGRKLRLNKSVLILGTLGGAMLCLGFNLQLVGLSVSKSPTSCGFFTASYAVFVPFITWIFYKKRPDWMMFVGVGMACAGLLILNFQSISMMENKNVFWGNMITLVGSLFFAMQITLGDYALHEKKLDMINFTVVQVTTCTIFMCLAAVIFECKQYPSVQINWEICWWQLVIVALFGTAFAYFSQTYAQQHLSPAETSLILACESPLGAILAISLGDDPFSWWVCVGGLLVVSAVVFIEVLPQIIKKQKPLG